MELRKESEINQKAKRKKTENNWMSYETVQSVRILSCTRVRGP